MSAGKAAKRPAPILKDPISPLKALTPQSKAGSSGSPAQVPGDSPERANKRARFNANGPGGDAGSGTGKGGNGATLGPPSLGEIGRGMSGGWGGAVWVTDRVAELEGLCKECVLAATLLLQYKAYSQKLGIDSKRIPIHLSQRLEIAWGQYGSLRSYIESYLLQCAQAASSPSKSLPTASSLVPGLPPLPTTPSIPNTASNLLQATPHPGRFGPVSLDKLISADPAKGLVGYEKGQVVFPGVPSDIAMPIPTDIPVEPESKPGAESGVVGSSEIMPISLPGVDYGTQEKDQGLGLGLGDAGGMDLDSLGIAELTALINGDGGLGDAGLGDQGQSLLSHGGGSGTMGSEESKGLMESLNEYAQAQNAMMGGGTMLPELSQASAPLPPPQANPVIVTAAEFAFPGNQPQPIPPPQPQSQPQPSFTQPPPQLPNPPPTQNFDFDFSTIEGPDSLDPMDGLADIDFNELAGMFGGSGRTTRAQTPVAASAPAGAAQPSASAVSADPVPGLGLALSNLYPQETEAGSAQQATAAFDSSLGGIDLDDFDFTGGEEGMPGVDGDEFESIFSEWK